MSNTFKFIDLFCGIGGFRYAMEAAAKENKMSPQCVFSSDIDKHCQDVYNTNFGETPYGDISKIDVEDIPDHDILLAGFPCQPFSIIGQMKGFEDTRGTLFFEIAKIIASKNPKAFVLENVKLLVGHDKGETMKIIIQTLKDLKYNVSFQVFNALDYGLPQKRERVFIVGYKDNLDFIWPSKKIKMKSLDELLEKNIEPQYFVSNVIKKKRFDKQKKTEETTIWHENKSGNISAYPYSCALRAGASYNYLLVNGERRLTGREMLRLQGFPERFKITCSYTQTRKQAGNSLPIPVAKAVLGSLIASLLKYSDSKSPNLNKRYILLQKKETYSEKPKAKNSRKVQSTISA